MPESDKLANNVVLILISRIAMIAATAALPIAGWMLERGISAVDRIGEQVNVVHDQLTETGGTIRLIQQTQQVQNGIIVDHEQRMRSLERINANRSN